MATKLTINTLHRLFSCSKIIFVRDTRGGKATGVRDIKGFKGKGVRGMRGCKRRGVRDISKLIEERQEKGIKLNRREVRDTRGCQRTKWGTR